MQTQIRIELSTGPSPLLLDDMFFWTLLCGFLKNKPWTQLEALKTLYKQLPLSNGLCHCSPLFLVAFLLA